MPNHDDRPSKYPLLPKLIEGELSRLKKNGSLSSLSRDQKEKAILEGIGCSINTLNAWRKGITFPDDNHSQRMAQFFYPDDTTGQETFLKALAQARTETDILTIDELKHRRSLKLGYLEYPPFCRFRAHHGVASANGGFLDELWIRLLSLSQFNHQPYQRTGVKDAVEDLLHDAYDIALALFDTIDRSLDIHCFHSACRVSLNGVTLEREPKRLAFLRGSLTLGADPSLHHGLQPAALRNEVGYSYLRDGLKIPESQIRPVKLLSPDSFADALLRSGSEGQTDVVIADEFNILNTIPILRQRDKRPTILFPLATEKSIRSIKQQLPLYLVGLGSVSRRQVHLLEYLDRVLRLLLQTEIELISGLYMTLYTDVRDLVATSLNSLDREGLAQLQETQQEPCVFHDKWIDACAVRVARYTLRLSDDEGASAFDELNLPWKHILHRVRSRIGPLPEGTEYPNEGKLSLVYRTFEPFCGPSSSSIATSKRDISMFGFMGQLLKPMEQYIDLDGVGPIIEARDLPDRQLKLWPDVRIGLFETAQRTRRWRYIGIPTRLPLNSVILDHTFQGQLDRVRTCFRVETKDASARDDIHPIVLRSGSGYEYLLHTLDFQERNLRVVRKLDPAEYASELIAGTMESRAVVVDFLTCLAIMIDPALQGRGRLVYPLFTSDTPRKSLPEYGFGIAINRDSKVWIDYFADAFPLALHSEEEWFVHCYVSVYRELLALLKSRFELLHKTHQPSFKSLYAKEYKRSDGDVAQNADRWARYCLYLDATPVPSRYQGWADILAKARHKIGDPVRSLANSGEPARKNGKRKQARNARPRK